VEQNHPKWPLIDWALKLSDEDLRRTIEFLSQGYKRRFTRAAEAAALAFKPGDWVEVLQDSRKLPAGTRGHVITIRGMNVEGHFPDHGLRKLTATLVRKVDSPAK
jgi:hypothetical protein